MVIEKICKGECGQSKPLEEFYKRNSGHFNRTAVCKKCRPQSVYNRKSSKEYYNSQYNKDWRLKIRFEVIEAYGGKCNCCGETEQDFLCVDHIDNDGNLHRKLVKTNIYQWLKKNNFPKDNFQLLCADCNLSKSKNGECIHKKHLTNVI